MTRLVEIDRNDIQAAVLYVEELLDVGRELNPDDAQVLLMLQDDAGVALVSALNALYADRVAAGKKVPAFWYE